MQVSEIPIDDIIVGHRFRKDIGNVKELAESIKAKGLIQPITVDTEYNLLAGGRRLQAARVAGCDEIPVILRDVEDEADAREIELHENIHRKDMSWTEELALIDRIHDLMVEKAKANGKKWNAKKTAKLLDKSESALSDGLTLAKAVEAVPELAKCSSPSEARKKLKKLLEHAAVQEAAKTEGSKTGKFIKWADSHYHVGDALKGVADMHTGAMDFFEVDPPYAIDLANRKSDKTEGIDEYNEIPAKEYPAFLTTMAGECYRVLRPNRFAIWWFGFTHYQLVLDTLRKAGFAVNEIPAIWNKIEAGTVTNAPQTNLGNSYEPFFICRKGVPDLRTRGRSNCFSYKPIPAPRKIHPTERPVPLIKDIFQTFVYPGAHVCIPFLGSGNSILAAYSSQCLGFGWDLSSKYKDGFLARVNTMFEDELAAEKEKPNV